jgi:polysaccharide biosynthesis protein PslH
MSALHSRKRLLFIAPVMPAAQGNGLAMRVGVFLDAYSRHFDIDLVIIPVAGQAAATTPFALRRCVRHVVIAPRSDSHFDLVSRLRDPVARLEAFRRYGQPSLAAGITDAVVEELRTWIGHTRYAVVHLSRLYLSALARAAGSHGGETRFILDCDENDIATQQSIGAMLRRRGELWQSDWRHCEAEAFARLARQSLARFDVVFASSRKDCASLTRQTGHDRVLLVPNVVAIPPRRLPDLRRPRARTVLFVGTLAYDPNADAVEWFVARVWPGLVRRHPGSLRLVIAGAGSSPRIARLAGRQGIAVAANVPDMAPLYARADLAIAPLRAGGGSRIKLIEAAAHGVPAVATRVGAEGLRFASGRDILLADAADTFIAACRTMLTDEPLARRIAVNARNRVLTDHDRARWTVAIGDFAARLGLSRGPSPSDLLSAELAER